jgi:hypothetical protein
VLFATPFNELVDLAEEELLRLADRHQAPVSRVGNAFTRLALGLSERWHSDRHRLLAARERYLGALDDLAAFSDLARAILTTADFIDVY